MFILLHLLKFAKSTSIAFEICLIYSLFLPQSLKYSKGMSSDNDSVSSFDSGSGSGRSGDEGSGQLANEGGIPIEVIVEKREDLAEEIAESSLSAKAGYKWVVVNVRTQYSLFRRSCILNVWLNCVSILERGPRRSIVCFERVNFVDCICHDQEGATEGFFYMYVSFFSITYVDSL